MTKQDIQTRIDEKQKELETLVQTDNQDGQDRIKRFQINQKKADQLQGGIDTLKELLVLADEG